MRAPRAWPPETTEGIFLDSRVRDTCLLEIVSDSEEITEIKAIREKPGKTFWQHVLNRESVRWLRWQAKYLGRP